MKKKVIGLICMAGIGMLLSSCRSSSTLPSYSFETECLGTELDGSQTLQVWGKGRNRADAVEQARKNAVRDVLFKGIRAGSGECNVRPLLTEVNAQEKYESYFNAFFKDRGPYRKFVNMKDTKTNSAVRADDRTQTLYGITVRVLRSELKQQLINDGILKP